MSKIIFMIIFLQIALIAEVNAQDCIIKVRVSGYNEIVGKLSIGLFNDSENFPRKNENNMGVQIEIADTVIEYTFVGLKSGEYALAVYHDENSNGKLDTNFLGIPSEDFVFSNYASGTFGPPSFEDAKFFLMDSVKISLDLNK